MKSALIATVYNEAPSITRWLEALSSQSSFPDEFVIVDGGSTDETVLRIEAYSWPAGFPKPRVIVQRCNIAEGRNIAVRHSTAPVIIATDAGSLASPGWFEAMAAPFNDDVGVAVVAGHSELVLHNPFQKRLAGYLAAVGPVTSETAMPSSRCVAFRRDAWEAVGGYPEWMTLTGEDAVFNHNLRAAGFRFQYQPSAVVFWEARPDLKSYLRMMYLYGYGAAEAGMATGLYLQWLASVIFPPLILLSRNPFRDVPLRYRRNFASASGWVMGRIFGHKPPPGWRKVQGVLLSPETLRLAER